MGGKSGFLSSTKVQTAKAKVDIRLVDVKTAHAYFSAIGAGEASVESGEIAGFGSRADYDATLNDRAIAAAISDVIDRLVSRLQERKWRTDILDIKGSQVFVAGGRRQGMREGDTLAVMEAGDTVKSRQTGFDVTLPPTTGGNAQGGEPVRRDGNGRGGRLRGGRRDRSDPALPEAVRRGTRKVGGTGCANLSPYP